MTSTTASEWASDRAIIRMAIRMAMHMMRQALRTGRAVGCTFWASISGHCGVRSRPGAAQHVYFYQVSLQPMSAYYSMYERHCDTALHRHCLCRAVSQCRSAYYSSQKHSSGLFTSIHRFENYTCSYCDAMRRGGYFQGQLAFLYEDLHHL